MLTQGIRNLTFNSIIAFIGQFNNPVINCIDVIRVITAITIKHITAGAAIKNIITVFGNNGIISAISSQNIISIRAYNGFISRCTINHNPQGQKLFIINNRTIRKFKTINGNGCIGIIRIEVFNMNSIIAALDINLQRTQA